jgi:hypothetical protein
LLLPSNAITVTASVADAVPFPVPVPITVPVTFTVAVTITITITVTITVAVPVAIAITLAFASAVTIATAAANVFAAVIVACQRCCHHHNKCRAVTLASSVTAYIALRLFFVNAAAINTVIAIVSIINNAVALAFHRCLACCRSRSHCCCHSC